MSFTYILLSVLFLHVKCEINKLKLKLKDKKASGDLTYKQISSSTMVFVMQFGQVLK